MENKKPLLLLNLILVAIVVTYLVISSNTQAMEPADKNQLKTDIESSAEAKEEKTDTNINEEKEQDFEIKEKRTKTVFASYTDGNYKGAGTVLIDDADNKSEMKAEISNDSVILYNGKEKKIIARSIDNAAREIDNLRYEKAELSPNNKFVLLGSIGYEWINVEIYDIASGTVYRVKSLDPDIGTVSDGQMGTWLNDSRLQINGGCGMGISCGRYESVSASEPWIVDMIKGISAYEINGSIFYTNDGQTRMIALSSGLNNIIINNYEPKLSPDKKYILYYESKNNLINPVIYDIENDSSHRIAINTYELFQPFDSLRARWLESSRIEIVGFCGVKECGVLTSEGQAEPWEVRSINK